MQYAERPQWFKTWEDTGLIAFDDKNADGRIQYYNDANEEFTEIAESYGWKGNELTLDKDILVLANPEIAGLPDWVVAFIAAGAIAAALSTAAGLLLVISAAVSHDLVKSVVKRNISDRNELLVGRICAANAICLAGKLGFDLPAFVAEVVAFAFGIAAASLFPVIVLGIFSVGVNGSGAICGMLTGLVFTSLYINAFKGILFSPMFKNVPENWLFGISPEGISVVGAILNFAVTLSVSYCTRKPRQAVVDLVYSLRTPRAFQLEKSHG